MSVTDRLSHELPPATPAPEEKEKQLVSKDIDWTEAQIDRDEGMTLSQLADKYGCSIASVCHHTKKASDTPRPVKVAVTRTRRRAGVRLVNVSAAPSERYNTLMDELLAKRAEIDKAIEALKQLENYI